MSSAFFLFTYLTQHFKSGQHNGGAISGDYDDLNNHNRNRGETTIVVCVPNYIKLNFAGRVLNVSLLGDAYRRSTEI